MGYWRTSGSGCCSTAVTSSWLRQKPTEDAEGSLSQDGVVLRLLQVQHEIARDNINLRIKFITSCEGVSMALPGAGIF